MNLPEKAKEHRLLSARVHYAQRALARKQPPAVQELLALWCAAEDELSALTYDWHRFTAQRALAEQAIEAASSQDGAARAARKVAECDRMLHGIELREKALAEQLRDLRERCKPAVEMVEMLRAAGWNPDPAGVER